MAEYDLLQDVTVGTKPREAKETESGDVDHSSVAKAVEHGRADTLGTSGAMHLQRMAGNAAMGALVQRKASGEQGEENASPVHDVIGKGGGSSLDAGVRGQMEAKMGQDFGDVKVHTGSEAANASKSVQAQAFTVGNEIVFNEGKYAPHSPEGQRTIAHELTHVVQQRSGSVDGTPREGGISVSDPSDKYEQEAEANADHVMSGGGHEGHDHAAPAAAAAGVQREADDEAPVQTMRDDTAVQREEGEEDEAESVQALRDDTAVQRESEGGEAEEEEVQTLRDETAVQRESEGGEAEEEEVQTLRDETVQRESEGEEEEASE